MRVPSRFVSCLCLFFVACSTTNTNNTTTDSTSSNNVTNALAQTQKALGYIVVHRNDPLFLQPLAYPIRHAFLQMRSSWLWNANALKAKLTGFIGFVQLATPSSTRKSL